MHRLVIFCDDYCETLHNWLQYVCLMLPRKKASADIINDFKWIWKQWKNYLPGFESQGLSHKINLKGVGDKCL